MVKRILLALSALCFAQAATASNRVPPDVQPYVPIAATYASGTTLNVEKTDTPPAYATMPANIPTVGSGWVKSFSTGPAYCSLGASGCTITDRKFRTNANITHINFDDPIRNYAEPGTAHCHEYYGNQSINAYSTFVTARNRPRSTIGGGVINASGYWFMCPIKVNPFGNGKNYAVHADFAGLYYVNPGNTGIGVGLPNGYRAVFGTYMDDPDHPLVDADIAAANAQPGTAGRYTKFPGQRNDAALNGWLGWTCAGSGAAQGVADYNAPYLKKPDGSDPFGGHCTAGMTLNMDLHSQDCWDGTNLWSPGGYKHLRYSIWDSVAQKNVCPNNWYRVPRLEIKISFSQHGPSDYMTWRCSSDDGAAAKAGRPFSNCESGHGDYLEAWDRNSLDVFQKFCLGIGSSTNGTECAGSFLGVNSSGNYLYGIESDPAPDGSRNPQVDFNKHYDDTDPAQMFLLPSGNYTGLRSYTTH